MARRVGRPLSANQRMVAVCDAREYPHDLLVGLSPARIHAVMLARVMDAVAKIAEEQRPQHWSGAVAAAISRFHASREALFYLAPLPFDPFETEWSGEIDLEEQTLQTIERLRDGTDQARIVNDLLNIAVAFAIAPEHRDAFVQVVTQAVVALPDETFTMACDCALQLAARWKRSKLSEALVNTALERFAKQSPNDLGAPVRFALLGAASEIDVADWSRKAGDYATGFAFVLRPGQAIENMLASLELTCDLAPSLASMLSPARSFALLARDHVPLRKPKTDAHDAGSGSDPEGKEDKRSSAR